jgi:hypothetical protein
MGDNIPNSRRKRVENSCDCCHRRKVRCDVNAHGPPCTNCRLDSRQCIMRVPLKRYDRSCLTQWKLGLHVTQLPIRHESVTLIGDIRVGGEKVKSNARKPWSLHWERVSEYWRHVQATSLRAVQKTIAQQRYQSRREQLRCPRSQNAVSLDHTSNGTSRLNHRVLLLVRSPN